MCNMTWKWFVGGFIASVLAEASGAQVHTADVILSVGWGNRIETNRSTDGIAIEPARVFAARFGAEGFADFTNDPGFDSLVGALPPGAVFGFDIMRGLRRWDAAAQEFPEVIPTERIRIRRSGIDRFTPTSDMIVPGYAFGDVSGAGVFHHHLGFALIGGGSAMSGVWLLELTLWTEGGVLSPSEPFWVVFAQGEGLPEQEGAMRWVLDHLTGPACVPDFNADGALNFFDVQAFLAALASHDARADLNGDGMFNFFDVQNFLGLFAGGCN
ncbi:MAG: hypothetical protein KJZ65_02800 [Phycisphaerales bacterium]|nr:hypothetical protein [Phycisphaerales bacterium]